MFNENRKCETCSSTVVNGTPHTCDHNAIDVARMRLENWLSNEYTILT